MRAAEAVRTMVANRPGSPVSVFAPPRRRRSSFQAAPQGGAPRYPRRAPPKPRQAPRGRRGGALAEVGAALFVGGAAVCGG